MYGYADELATIDGQVIEHVVRDKQEVGFFALSQVGEEVQPQREPLENNGNLLHRLESLEQRVNHLSSMVDWQIQQYEQRAESYKDMLVHRLETLLAQERKRTDRLLVQYNLLADRLKLNKIKPRDKKVEPPEEKTAVSGEGQGADPKHKRGLLWMLTGKQKL